VDPELSLAALPVVEAPRRHGRFVAAAAVVALLVGSVAILGDGPGGDDRSRLEVDEDGNKLPAPEPGTLTPLGPHDGRDSIQLPVTVEPNAGLASGDVVTATGTGFAPGERVGIVMCANEAGGDDPEQRAGIDACSVNPVTYADADADGKASGTFTVTRVLTTGATGTVDCAAEADRCIIAMGALNDYDRSGGLGLTFAGGGEPIDVPTISVSPSEGLSDGDTVHLEGEGFQPGPLMLSQCSIDPSGCWSLGAPFQLSADEVSELGLMDQYGGAYEGVGLLADASGHVRADVQVWRFLPTVEPTSYIDCAVSTCSLRLSSEAGGYAPAPPVVAFAPGGSGPTPPAIAVAPTRDVQPGDEVVVRGAGFQPGAYYSISLCVSPPGDPMGLYDCIGGDGSEDVIDDDGGFAKEFEIPDLDILGGVTATTACSTEGDCLDAVALPEEQRCDGIHSVCSIRVDAYVGGTAFGPPQFPAVPVTVTYRR